MARINSSISDVVPKLGKGEEFVIIELTKDGPKSVYDGDGQLLTFREGKAAAVHAAKTSVGGRKFQPRRVKDDAWKDREASRFKDKSYQTLPWSEHRWWRDHAAIHALHYPHVSTKNSVGLMAFTEDEGKGSADIQTAMKPGKYLERFFGEILDVHIIRDLCTIFSNKFEDNCLIFGETEDEFEQLYTEGPSSCMSHPLSKFASHIHPVRVYAAGDLKMAYMKRDGRIVARTLVYPEKKKFAKIYGDGGRMGPLLKKEGYSEGPPVGAKIQRVLTWEDKTKKSGRRAFVLPHIDNIGWVRDEGDHLVIGNPNETMPAKGCVKLIGATGVSEWLTTFCPCCKKDDRKSGSMKNVYVDIYGHQQLVCEDCLPDLTFTCPHSKALVMKTQAVELADGGIIWNRTFSAEGGFECPLTRKKYLARQGKKYFNPKTKKWALASIEGLESNTDLTKCSECSNYVAGGRGTCGGLCDLARQRKRDELYRQSVESGRTASGYFGATATSTTSNSLGSATQCWSSQAIPYRDGD